MKRKNREVEGMNMMKKTALLLFVVCFTIGMTGCNSSKDKSTDQKVEGLERFGEISVISREEGSGTRSVFAELAGFQQKSAQSKEKDLTKSDAEIQNDAAAVIASVEKNPSAIGYISMGSIGEKTKYKTLKIEGKELSLSSVKKGEYPLSRSFHLVYTGKLSDLEQDFLSYVKSQGQKIVGDSYVSIYKAGNFLSWKPKGTLKINGSTSVVPLMKQLAEEYMKQNPNAKVEISASDSTEGINHAMEHKCNFGMVSRELKDYEKELLNDEVIAKDGIAVIVHKNNPVKNLSLEKLRKIYIGEIHKWEDINQ